jgi:hypothetical protein
MHVMKIKYFVALAAAWMAGGAHAVAPAPVTNLQPLALDSTGHPRIQWTQSSGAASYIVERRSDIDDAGETACLSSAETLVSGWCRFSVPAGSGSGTMSYTDKLIRIDPSSPVEYQYRVAAADAENNASAFVSRWANSCPIVVANPEQIYLDSVRNSSNQPILVASDIASTTDVQVTEIFSGTTRIYYVVSNDKYIAMFGTKGGLVSLVHRNYGKDFVPGYKLATTNHYKVDGSQAWKLLQADYSDDANPPPGTEMSSGSQGVPDADIIPGGVKFTWENAGGYEITTTWTLQSLGSSGLHGKISAVPVGASVGIEEIWFPFVESAGYPEVDLLWPQDIGRKFSHFPYKSGSTLYEEGLAKGSMLFNGMSMQFMGASYPIDAGNGNLLYIATEDPKLSPKAFRIQPNAVSGGVPLPSGLYLRHFPFNGTGFPESKIDATDHEYDVVMQPMCGDVAKIAKRYRKYAVEQEWTKVGEDKTIENGNPFTQVPAKTVARIDVPLKLKEGVFWWSQNNAENETFKFMRDYANDELEFSAVGFKGVIGPAHGVDVGIHLYNWHSPGFDRNIPEYAEKVGGPVDFAGYIAAVEGDGTLVMPYISATGIDVGDRTDSSFQCNKSTGVTTNSSDYYVTLAAQTCGWWNRDYTIQTVDFEMQDQMIYAARGGSKADALVIGHNGGTGGLIAGMARLDSPFWYNIINGSVGTIFDAGASGVYLDTFGAGYQPDYAELWGVDTDGKPVGHNENWRYEMGAISEIARLIGEYRDSVASTPHKRFVGAEHFGEAFIRDVDLFTVYSEQPAITYPLAQLVYSDYQLFAGPQGRTADSWEALRLRYGRAFTWGMQPGLSSIFQVCGASQCDQDDIDEIIDYLKTLTKARKNLVDFLGYGELLGVPVAIDPDVVDPNWCLNQNCTKTETAELPAIQVARWLSKDGERAFIATNTSDEAATTTVPIPPNWVRPTAPACLDENDDADTCATVVGGNLVIAMAPMTVRRIDFGTASSTDIDDDGVANAVDNCPGDANPLQTDINENDIGDTCENGLTVSYFNDTDTDESEHISALDDKLVAPAVLQRIEPNIDFYYGIGSGPGGGVHNDFYSARFTGRLLVPAYTGDYEFCLKADDGVRLWIDGHDLWEDEHWTGQDSVSDCATVSLTAGQTVPITMEFFDLDEHAIAELKWSWPGHAAEVVPTTSFYAE